MLEAGAYSPAGAAAAPRRVLVVATIAALSGFAGLGYEIVWTRLLAVSLGHEIVAVLGVVSALFAGLALGSLVPGRRIAASPRPGRWYAGLELVIGLWALALVPLAPLMADLVPLLVPVDAAPTRQWLVAFALPFWLLLPATLAMGATLPALEAVLAPRLASGRAVGPVYAANTLGAVAGTLVTTFLIIPAVGLSATLVACAAVNLACAAAMWLAEGGSVAPAPKRPAAGRPSLRALAPLFVGGLLGLGYEVLAIRVVGQILENTVYTFALLLAVWLLGTALGAALRDRLAARPTAGDALTSGLVAATALACLGGAAAMATSDAILLGLREALPATVPGRLAAELGIAAVAFLPPTVAMGALFAQLAQAASDRDGGMGPGLAVNTLGAALAPIVFGPVLMPLVGAKLAFAGLAAGYVLALPNRRPPALAAAAAIGVAAVALVLSPLSLRFVQVPPGGALVWHRDGVMAAVSVVRNRAGDHHLQVNNHFRMGGSASERSDHRQAHIPLLLHPAPQRALFLGLGTGATVSAAADHPGLVVDGVELVPEVVESFPLFARSAPQIGRNPDLHIHVADARRFVRAPGAGYDVIVADLYHPSVDGSGALYAREHFAAIRDRLAAGGLFCQWLPLHQLDIATLRVIVRTFLDVFPQASAHLAQLSVETPLIALVGAAGPRTYPTEWLGRRIVDPALRARLAALDLADDFGLFGLHLGGAAALRAFAGEGPLNTDDRPVVTAEAPRLAYAAAERPGDRLLTLLAALRGTPDDVLAAPATAEAEPDARDHDRDRRRRLVAYWQARDRYLEIGVRTLGAGARGRDLVGEIAPQLVDLVRLSPDFEPAYRPVLAMARQRAVSDPAVARRLLEALDRARPDRPEARRLLSALPPG
ncbi:fused MFS/spermidine synthase [Rhodoplanes sp. TEM]|uniref:Fused MFS/spermidine synthase n=1 Tax=Rhodoplanes tepidamans TaxID=200616 RepID=A0ABT5JCR2_RHOTP|nr:MULTISPECIES: fused MFS/spermidine synthase [Rhodoplanes]MDC7787298.1 fused MFS/spermidine synthase [Rhodoplanes tepidamans]MDC7986713.1 fused MFS/spermidine synthase [Rhodoplanes sp. TEM]MDQ0357833.1 spermidine synthase [Rhodoplanes tepidamans]